MSVRIKGNDIETLQKLAGEVADVMKDTKGTTDIDDGMEDSEPQLTISVDKKKAAKYGLTVAQVYQLVSAKMADSKTVTTITTDIKDYKVYVQTEEQADTKLSDIKDMTFSYTNKNGKEKEIPLTKICEMKETSTLSTISRDAQTRYITVSCGVDEDHNVTLVSNKLQKAIDKLDIPDGYKVEMTGEDETINESMKQLVLMLVLAVIFIYLIMVVQFQSLLSPFIIMFSIPLAFTGGFTRIASDRTGDQCPCNAWIYHAFGIDCKQWYCTDRLYQSGATCRSIQKGSNHRIRKDPCTSDPYDGTDNGSCNADDGTWHRRWLRYDAPDGDHTDRRTGLWYDSHTDCDSVYLRPVQS